MAGDNQPRGEHGTPRRMAERRPFPPPAFSNANTGDGALERVPSLYALGMTETALK